MAEQTRLMDHILRVYDYMEDHAIDKAGDPIFEGMTTQVITACGLSNNYYTPIFRFLKGGNYITQLKRGGGGSMSMWQLNGRPNPDDFEEVVRESGANNNSGTKSLKAVIDMQQRVAKIESTQNQHTKILTTLQAAIITLSNKVYGVGSGNELLDMFSPQQVKPVTTSPLSKADFEGLDDNGDS